MLCQISDHTWYLPKDDQTDRPALGYVSSGRSSLMVDAGNSPDHISHFYGNVRSIGLPDPEFVVLTHWHWNHVFGLSGSPAKSIAHALTNERLQNMQRWDWSDSSLNSRVAAGVEIPFAAEMIKKEMPMRHSFKVKPADISFVVQCAVRVEDLECQLIHVGGSHSDDSIVIYVPHEGVLFLGDCCYENPYRNGSLKLAEFQTVISALEKIEAKWFLPAHDSVIEKDKYIPMLHRIEEIGIVVNDTGDFSKGRKLLEDHYGRPLSDSEIEFVDRFVKGNKTFEMNPEL
jgi:glyoxylase-like metal-dependent hydrolase (beta-lactamase superfamily II)